MGTTTVSFDSLIWKESINAQAGTERTGSKAPRKRIQTTKWVQKGRTRNVVEEDSTKGPAKGGEKWGRQKGKTKTFLEALKGKEVIEYKVEDKEYAWLEACAGGHVNSLDCIPALHEIFELKGYFNIAVIPLGGNMVLLKSDDTNLIREYVYADKHTLDRSCLDAARICITMIGLAKINKFIKLKVNGHVFRIKVSKEKWRLDPEWWSCRDKSEDGDDNTTVSNSSSMDFINDSNELLSCGGSDEDGIDSMEEVEETNEHHEERYQQSPFGNFQKSYAESIGNSLGINMAAGLKMIDQPGRIGLGQFVGPLNRGMSKANEEQDVGLMGDKNGGSWCSALYNALGGPRPFQSLDGWLEVPRFKEIIKEKWETALVEGWGGFRCKEKLKELKNFLKRWNKEVYGEKLKELKNFLKRWNKEVKEAIQDCSSEKAPGPYVLNFKFIKYAWDVLEEDIMSFMREFHANSKLVDFTEAYNCVNWDFLDNLMEKSGFGERWRKWIMECLGSASISILVNGSPTEEFKSEQGLRQGDPLQCKIRVHMAIKGILRWFEQMSGLKINFKKSSLIGLNTEESWLTRAAKILGCKKVAIPFMYLGKWWARFETEQSSPWKKVIVEKYYGNDNAAGVGNVRRRQLSKVWADIVSIGLEGTKFGIVVGKGLRWEVGEENNIRFWKDVWVGDDPLGECFQDLEIWKGRRNLFGRDYDEKQKLVELISSAGLVKEKKGRRIWKFDKDELYTSKKADALMLSSQRILDADVCDAIWNQFLLGRIGFFAWRMFLDRLPTKLNLDRGNIEAEGGELICPICKLGVEELNHVLLQCDLVRQVWAKIFLWWDIEARLMGAIHTDYRQIISGLLMQRCKRYGLFYSSSLLGIYGGLGII
ncbi:hypothetical protein SLEP1_g44161 [Rubroshorea leprosula]|uniref:Reverse transcriptase zinc-binding domain-containing protein n=1 Tax=Rubroshorea leprosula TaxID=152421 RepID=A0AAV5LFC5_9ROSI|nr:hypothetical protein SLEP1_g44161 [Rubroshorea leprosula]